MAIQIVSFFSLLTLTVAKDYFISDEECLNYTIYPVQYELNIKPFFRNSFNERFYYDCDEVITVITDAPNIYSIELDAKDLEIKSCAVMDGKVNIINEHRPYEYAKRNGKLHIYFREPLKQYNVYKTQYNIKISFMKYVEYDSSGIFVAKYEDGGPKFMFTTRLSPYKAKYFFPCIDNHKFESVFKFKVHATQIYPVSQYNTTLVIAREQSRISPKDKTVVIDFIPSPQVALHQVGFHHSSLSSLQTYARSTNDTLIIWAPKNKLHHYEFISGFGKAILDLINAHAAVDRPIVNGPINLVSVPGDLNSYEVDSWNLLTISDHRLTFLPEYTSISQLEKMTFELAQQLSRIWLGNPGEIERTRWKEEWFKEGVATYLAYNFLTQLNHGTHIVQRRRPIDVYGLQMKHGAMAVDWHHTTPALVSFNRTLAIDIPSRHKELVTLKTASLLWMIENWLEGQKFHQALMKYINSRRGKFISLEDFTNSLDLDTIDCEYQFFNGSTSSKVLKSWFHHPGYPNVQVQVLRDRTPNAIQLKQKHFSFIHKYSTDSDFLIPISYLVQNHENCFNCHQPKFTIGVQTYTFEENLNGGWILLNRNASGYYRVNYDDITWKLIAKTLNENPASIDEFNRAQIVNDVFALYVAGDMEYHLALEVLNYLENERSYTVWDSVISGFELLKIEGADFILSKYLYEQWQVFMRKMLKGVYTWIINTDQEYNNRMFRSRLVEFACSVHHEPCLNHLRRMFKEYRIGRQRIDPDSRQAGFYMLLNENQDELGYELLNNFEKEDAFIAKYTKRKEDRLLYMMPVENPNPIPIMMSTSSPTEISTTQPGIDVNSSKSTSASSIVIYIHIFLLCMSNFFR